MRNTVAAGRRGALRLAVVLAVVVAGSTTACATDPPPPPSAHPPTASPSVSAALASQLAAARQATAAYATDLEAAKRDGYQIITPMMPEMGFHYLNPKIEGFHVSEPPILVYLQIGSTWQLGAVEWVFPTAPANPPLEGATYGSFPAACHYADGTFVPTETESECAKAIETGYAFTFWHPDLTTLHVWLWYHNPAGLYNSTNPLVQAYS